MASPSVMGPVHDVHPLVFVLVVNVPTAVALQAFSAVSSGSFPRARAV